LMKFKLKIEVDLSHDRNQGLLLITANSSNNPV
jgi:hypothetical protein